MKDLTNGDLNCFYCVEYNKLYVDYPINKASFTKFKDLTPRCALHSQYICDNCQKPIHFNGISYCEECGLFTCVKCGEESLKKTKFFFYDYYYNISCKKCSKKHPTLDYLEFIQKHPVQLRKLTLDQSVTLWKSTEHQAASLSNDQKPWGSHRITSMAINNEQIELPESDTLTSEEVWDIKAQKWAELTGEEGDYHHKEIILPAMFTLLNLESYSDPKSIHILDVACGTGNVARKVARMGFNVSGVDYSTNMLAVAQAKNKEFNLSIDYKHLDARKLLDVFKPESFDIIYCNMALMDLEALEEVLQAISKLLKQQGIFVFSISHPIFSWPTSYTLRIPRDSQRGEDKIWVFDNYNWKKTLIKFEIIDDSFLYYTRPISVYINECVKNNLQIQEVMEPMVGWELIERHPRNHYYDDDRRPDFFLVKTKKL